MSASSAQLDAYSPAGQTRLACIGYSRIYARFAVSEGPSLVQEYRIRFAELLERMPPLMIVPCRAARAIAPRVARVCRPRFRTLGLR
jgi:hypothetical protein